MTEILHNMDYMRSIGANVAEAEGVAQTSLSSSSLWGGSQEMSNPPSKWQMRRSWDAASEVRKTANVVEHASRTAGTIGGVVPGLMLAAAQVVGVAVPVLYSTVGVEMVSKMGGGWKKWSTETHQTQNTMKVQSLTIWEINPIHTQNTM